MDDNFYIIRIIRVGFPLKAGMIAPIGHCLLLNSMAINKL